ncbi:PREDICTED: uncharacterized protein LOC109205517 [Nicotiana attenuata]|uniref:uncharacterized protein LOC109205517 n=1 Tax=Nicotiana attenuata TaxID=49451 RepID=UPI000904A341|nr:PREDICTED: uncharacterized protein LOC109205517 [Nicotiana attenuata]
MRPAPPGEKTKSSNPKLEKDNKRKRVSKTEDPQDKKTPARRLRKRYAQTGIGSAQDFLNDEDNDEEGSALVNRARKPVEVAEPSEKDTSSHGEDAPKGQTGKAPPSSEVEIVPLTSTTIPKGVNAETPNDNENALSEELGAATTGHSLLLPTYSEGSIEESNAMPKPDPNKVIKDDLFQGCFAEIEDANDFNDASSLFKKAQCLLIRNRDEPMRGRAQKVSGKKKALRLLCSQREEELKDLRTALAKPQKSESELDEQVTAILSKFGLLGPTSEANTLISQLQQKLDMIGQLRGEVDRVRADCQQWKKNMDQLAAEKEDVKAQLDSAESAPREVEGLEAELVKARTKAAQAKAEAAQAKVEAEKNKRETLEEIHARGFDLAEEIAEAQAREIDARFLVSSDDEDVVSGSRDGESDEDAPEREEAPEDKAPEDEDGTPGDVAPKID